MISAPSVSFKTNHFLATFINFSRAPAWKRGADSGDVAQAYNRLCWGRQGGFGVFPFADACGACGNFTHMRIFSGGRAAAEQNQGSTATGFNFMTPGKP